MRHLLMAVALLGAACGPATSSPTPTPPTAAAAKPTTPPTLAAAPQTSAPGTPTEAPNARPTEATASKPAGATAAKPTQVQAAPFKRPDVAPLPAALSFIGFSGTALLGFNASVRSLAGPLTLASVALMLTSIVLVSRTITTACAIQPQRSAAHS